MKQIYSESIKITNKNVQLKPKTVQLTNFKENVDLLFRAWIKSIYLFDYQFNM